MLEKKILVEITELLLPRKNNSKLYVCMNFQTNMQEAKTGTLKGHTLLLMEGICIRETWCTTCKVSHDHLHLELSLIWLELPSKGVSCILFSQFTAGVSPWKILHNNCYPERCKTVKGCGQKVASRLEHSSPIAKVSAASGTHSQFLRYTRPEGNQQLHW